MFFFGLVAILIGLYLLVCLSIRLSTIAENTYTETTVQIQQLHRNLHCMTLNQNINYLKRD